MSMKQLAIATALKNHYNHANEKNNLTFLMEDGRQYSPGVDLYPSVHTGNTNVAFCGVMVVSIIVAVIAMCYCCHKGARKRENEMNANQQCRWHYGSSTLPLHIYTVEGHQFCESEDLVLNDINNGRNSTPSPPPEYETVIGLSNDFKEENAEITNSFIQFQQPEVAPASYNDIDDTGLPSYNMAVALEPPTARHI